MASAISHMDIAKLFQEYTQLLQTEEGRVVVYQLVADWEDCLKKAKQQKLDSSAEAGKVNAS